MLTINGFQKEAVERAKTRLITWDNFNDIKSKEIRESLVYDYCLANNVNINRVNLGIQLKRADITMKQEKIIDIKLHLEEE